MKRLFILALTAAAMISACTETPKPEAQDPKKANPKKPNKIIAWRDLSYMNDTVKVGEERTWNYVFFNTGIEPVRIKQALSSNMDCSCKIPAAEVPVGGQDTVKLVCKFPRAGKESVNVTVEHDTEQGFPILILMTEVVE